MDIKLIFDVIKLQFPFIIKDMSFVTSEVVKTEKSGKIFHVTRSPTHTINYRIVEYINTLSFKDVSKYPFLLKFFKSIELFKIKLSFMNMFHETCICIKYNASDFYDKKDLDVEVLEELYPDMSKFLFPNSVLIPPVYPLFNEMTCIHTRLIHPAFSKKIDPNDIYINGVYLNDQNEFCIDENTASVYIHEKYNTFTSDQNVCYFRDSDRIPLVNYLLSEQVSINQVFWNNKTIFYTHLFVFTIRHKIIIGLPQDALKVLKKCAGYNVVLANTQ